MDKHIVDIITDNYVRKYGIDDFNAKKIKNKQMHVLKIH